MSFNFKTHKNPVPYKEFIEILNKYEDEIIELKKRFYNNEIDETIVDDFNELLSLIPKGEHFNLDDVFNEIEQVIDSYIDKYYENHDEAWDDEYIGPCEESWWDACKEFTANKSWIDEEGFYK